MSLTAKNVAIKHTSVYTKSLNFDTGTMPNIARTSVINVGEIVVYDIVKDLLIASKMMTDGVPCHFSAAFVAGFTATLIASPVDVVKTRY